MLVLRSGFAHAQSNASFPEPAPPPRATPPVYTPPPPVYTPPPPVYTPPPPVYTPPAPVYAPRPSAPAVAPPSPVYTSPPASAAPLPTGLSSLPPLLPYQHGLPVPPGYRVVERSASGLLIGGGLTFAVSYVAGLGLAASQSFGNGTGYTVIPVAGPWAAIGGRTFKCKAKVAVTASESSVQNAINSCVGTAFDEVTTVVFLTADGLVQAAGAVLFLVGLGSGYEELVRADLPKTAVTRFPEGGWAVSLSGQF